MALKDAPVVEVLKFDEMEAYNHDRPISSLIRTQLLHLHHAENLVVPAKARTAVNINHLLTEREASKYIQKVTRLLHKYSLANGSAHSKKKKKTRKTAKKTASGSAKDQGRVSTTGIKKASRRRSSRR